MKGTDPAGINKITEDGYPAVIRGATEKTRNQLACTEPWRTWI